MYVLSILRQVGSENEGPLIVVCRGVGSTGVCVCVCDSRQSSSHPRLSRVLCLVSYYGIYICAFHRVRTVGERTRRRSGARGGTLVDSAYRSLRSTLKGKCTTRTAAWIRLLPGRLANAVCFRCCSVYDTLVILGALTILEYGLGELQPHCITVSSPPLLLSGEWRGGFA